MFDRSFALAHSSVQEVKANVPIVHMDKATDDPQRRRPDISRAEKLLSWRPRVALKDGIHHTVEYFRRELGLAGSPDDGSDGTLEHNLSDNAFAP